MLHRHQTLQDNCLWALSLDVPKASQHQQLPPPHLPPSISISQPGQPSRAVLVPPTPEPTDMALQSSLSQALSLSGFGICPQPNSLFQSPLPSILLSDTGLVLLKYQLAPITLRMKKKKEEEVVECKKKNMLTLTPRSMEGKRNDLCLKVLWFKWAYQQKAKF